MKHDIWCTRLQRWDESDSPWKNESWGEFYFEQHPTSFPPATLQLPRQPWLNGWWTVIAQEWKMLATSDFWRGEGYSARSRRLHAGLKSATDAIPSSTMWVGRADWCCRCFRSAQPKVAKPRLSVISNTLLVQTAAKAHTQFLGSSATHLAILKSIWRTVDARDRRRFIAFIDGCFNLYVMMTLLVAFVTYQQLTFSLLSLLFSFSHIRILIMLMHWCFKSCCKSGAFFQLEQNHSSCLQRQCSISKVFYYVFLLVCSAINYDWTSALGGIQEPVTYILLKFWIQNAAAVKEGTEAEMGWGGTLWAY